MAAGNDAIARRVAAPEHRLFLRSISLRCLLASLLAEVDIWHDVQPTLARQSSARYFNQPLGTAYLPDGLETLVLGDLFRQDLRYVSLPPALLHLTLGNCFPLQRHSLFWPPGLEELRIRQQFSQVPLDFVFPDSLRKIDCDGDILAL